MLLGDILNGKEKSHLVLVHDNINQNGKPLLSCFVKSLLESVDIVHAILWDVSPGQFISAFDPHLRERIFCYDGFSDPLGWNLTRNECDDSHVSIIHQNSNLAQVVKNNMAHCCSQSSNSGNVVKVAVVINSLSRLLLWKSSSAVCTLLNQLYSSSLDSQAGYQVAQVIGLVHTDLHDDQTLNAVNFLASSLLWITQDNEPKVADQSISSWCRILHKRKTGKVIKKVERFTISDEFELTEHDDKDWNVSSSTLTSEPVKEVDPTQNLTFNLKLTDKERQARSNLKLPFMFHEEKKSDEVALNPSGEGKVFYQPDEADDFDEEDPDDDLDI